MDPAKSSHRLQQDQQDQPAILDPSALVLFFPGPRSVTGEDVLELHVHGGRATVRAVLRAIPQAVAAAEAASDGDDVGTLIRYAEPGEFTRRAFLNGRLADLAQVDALGDVLAAETEQQRAAAVRSHSGSRSLAGTYEDWRSRLLLARGEIEALIDFSEDQHFDESPTELLASVATLVRGLLADIDVHVDAGHRAELLRSGVRVAIVGPPNAGKSSLMNRIVGREASIVSGEAGTTRDVVEVALDIRGFLCTFADTAGLRSSVHPVQSAGLALEGGDQKRSAVRDVGGVDSSGDLDAGGDNVDGSHAVVGSVEQEGIRRAKARASESDMVIALASIEGNDDADNGLCVHYDLESLRLAAAAPSCMVVINKRDRVPTKARLDELVGKFVSEVLATVPGLEGVEVATISCRDAGCHGLRQASGASSRPSETGADRGGIRALIDALAGSLARMTSLPADLADLLGVNERMSQLLQNCRRHLEAFMEEAGKGTAEVDDLDHHPGATRQARHRDPDVVVAAEHLREAAQDLARITGRGEGGDVEEVLGVVFEK